MHDNVYFCTCVCVYIYVCDDAFSPLPQRKKKKTQNRIVIGKSTRKEKKKSCDRFYAINYFKKHEEER